MRLYRKFIHALDNHGLLGLIRRALGKLRPGLPPDSAFHETDQPHPFDLAHRVDTSGYIPGEQLTPSDLYNTAYYGISPSTLTQALELLPEPATGFAFVDLGCGKGRALLVAAQFPFQQILGIEIAPDLARIAQANTVADPRVSIHLQDALTLTFPDTPLVIFLYHPFLAPQLRRVLANLERQRRHSPHSTYLLYANCTYQKLLARTSFREVWDHRIPLSPQDAAADRHRITHERFTLYTATFAQP
jgi:SAM-dependent methyltransferase